MPTFRFLIPAAALVLVACADASVEPQEVVMVEDAPIAAEPVTADAVEGDAVEGDAVAFDVSVMDGYILAPLKGRDVTAGYFNIRSDMTSERIVTASSPVAMSVELHTHTMTDGVMQMREVEGIDLPKGEVVTLEPGGLHLMMFGFASEEGQREAPLTLTLESGQTIDVTLPIRER